MECFSNIFTCTHARIAISIVGLNDTIISHCSSGEIFSTALDEKQQKLLCLIPSMGGERGNPQFWLTPKFTLQVSLAQINITVIAKASELNRFNRNKSLSEKKGKKKMHFWNTYHFLVKSLCSFFLIVMNRSIFFQKVNKSPTTKARNKENDCLPFTVLRFLPM